MMGLWKKWEDLCPEQIFLNSKATAVTEPEVSKNAKTRFFHANTIKKGQKMPNYDVHAKHNFFMPNHFKKGQIYRIWS